MSYTFGPGPMTPAVRAIVFANIGVYVAMLVLPAALVGTLGLSPEAVLTQGFVWQLGTHLFLHGDVFHVLFNMLSVWMFGVDLERRWGTQAFVKYYAVVGIGAGVCMVLVSVLPFEATLSTYYATTIGASGAVYGLLMAWGLIFPHRTILLFGVFPLTARVFVLIMGAIAFTQAVSAGGGGTVAHLAHLGGLAVGWWYLKTPIRKTPAPPRPSHLRRVH
ncbi:MAG: rhomboid family intramembrane serine protease [Acidobacteria bacterium]|nr:rhomboid family intramembrane serine protease [Acidobacteriota bacterium]